VNHIDLENRRAVITGGAEGFGRAIAERFLASGARVSLWDINRDLLAHTAGNLGDRGRLHTAVVDISDLAQVEAAAAATLQAWAGIDILIANAGLTGPNATTWEYPAADWGRVVEVNLIGTELAQLDIAVNCITPAAARTRIFEQMSQQHIDYMLSKIPRGRFLDVRELASLVAWLASEENSFTTGAVFDLSGGRSTY